MDCRVIYGLRCTIVYLFLQVGYKACKPSFHLVELAQFRSLEGPPPNLHHFRRLPARRIRSSTTSGGCLPGVYRSTSSRQRPSSCEERPCTRDPKPNCVAHQSVQFRALSAPNLSASRWQQPPCRRPCQLSARYARVTSHGTTVPRTSRHGRTTPGTCSPSSLESMEASP